MADDSIHYVTKLNYIMQSMCLLKLWKIRLEYILKNSFRNFECSTLIFLTTSSSKHLLPISTNDKTIDNSSLAQ